MIRPLQQPKERAERNFTRSYAVGEASRVVVKRQQAITKQNETKLARPLKVLVPLIRADIRDGEEAGVPYFIAAGEKLLEAKPQVVHGEWDVWVRKNFNRTTQAVGAWMRLAESKSRARIRFKQPRTLSEFTTPNRDSGHRPIWHAPIVEAIKRAHPDFVERKPVLVETEATMKRELAHEVIDIGYRVLATKLHPDKGNENGEGMQRLNEVRATLKRLTAKEWKIWCDHG